MGNVNNFRDMLRIELTESDAARFWTHVDRSGGASGCWLWVGGKTRYGYGVFCANGDRFRAHRVAYTLLRGELPRAELVIDHLCGVTACVNPSHMEIVSVGENVKRAIARRGCETHCKNGHELTPENLRIRMQDGYATRVCRACFNEYCRAKREKERGGPANPKNVAAGLKGSVARWGDRGQGR